MDPPPAREAEIVEEWAGHLEQEYQRALFLGASEDEARRRALACLDDESRPEPPVGRGTNPAAFARDFRQDVRYGVRTFARNPGFTALAVLSLALGIGGNTAMFTILSAVLLGPLPYTDSDRLVRAANTGSYPQGGLVALQQRSRTMEVAGYTPVSS
jgi:hypothetical protein